MKKLLVVLVLIAVTAGAFADDIFTSYNKPGNINVYASVGWYFWPEVSVAAEYVAGEFKIGTVPLDWGVAVRGGMDFWSGGVDYAVGALATLHLGLAVAPIEFYASLGACFYGPTSYFPVTVASYGGVTWWFSKKIGLVLENGYLGWYFWGAGLELKL
jgi:hypothetical protein